MSIIITAPAKLTTRLKITGVRADGYHLIDAEMVSLDLCDQIEITPGLHGIEVTGPYGAGVPTDHTNLVYKALELVGRTAQVKIHKMIPHGGGLGGGSSDAAAILRWAQFSDLVAAAGIGADVAYCLIGGRAQVSGIGEVVQPLAHIDATYTLVIPPLAVSTPAAYRAFDVLESADPGFTQDLINDLEPAALEVVPEMKLWRAAIADACGVSPTLAGSGATWFLEGDHQGALASLKEKGAEVTVAQTIRSVSESSPT
jgi:4-diphosphocytidyl-2-C-methyl-D-erythritol kinase